MQTFITATATDDSILAPRAYEEQFLTPIRMAGRRQ